MTIFYFILGLAVLVGLAVVLFKKEKEESKVEEADFSEGFDPLDDSPLEDPVDLRITHPTQGAVILKVNSWNAEKYAKFGPKVFPQRHEHTVRTSHRYFISGPGYNSYDKGGFDFIDAFIFYELFLAPNDGYVPMDPDFVGHGGEFGGDGNTGDFTPDAQPGTIQVDSTELGMAANTDPDFNADEKPEEEKTSEEADPDSDPDPDTDTDSGGDSGGD
jgi:hypothetical protein